MLQERESFRSFSLPVFIDEIRFDSELSCWGLRAKHPRSASVDML